MWQFEEGRGCLFDFGDKVSLHNHAGLKLEILLPQLPELEICLKTRITLIFKPLR
jgi:hypothetical protein